MADLRLQLEVLPQPHARALTIREYWGLGTAEILSKMDWTAGNLWVVMHRVRHRLREGLAAHCEAA